MNNQPTSTRRRRLLGAVLALAVVASACGGDDDEAEAGTDVSADVDGAVETDTSTDDAASADQGDGAAQDSEEPDATTEATVDLSGWWDTNFSDLELAQDGATLTGSYDNGTIEAALDGSTAEGVYYQSGRNCEERNGSTSWGTFTWDFAEDGLSFEGEYAWCGGSPGDWNGTLVEGPGLTPTPIGAGFPATTRYGYITVTLDAAGVAPAVARTTPLSQPLEDDEIAVIFEVTVDNLNPEVSWELPHGGLFWGEVDGDLYPSTSTTRVVLDPGRDEVASVVVPIPDRVDPASVRLWIQEAALDADIRRKPAYIGLDGVVDEPFEELATSSFDNGSPDPSCGGTYVYDRWVLDDDAGFKENGAPVSEASQLRGSGVPILGRAAEGELYLTTFAKATRDTSTCNLQVWRINPFAVVDDVPIGPVSSDSVTVHSWTAAPTDDIWTFPVPDDLRMFTVENADSTFQAAPWVAVGTFGG